MRGLVLCSVKIPLGSHHPKWACAQQVQMLPAPSSHLPANGLGKSGGRWLCHPRKTWTRLRKLQAPGSCLRLGPAPTHCSLLESEPADGRSPFLCLSNKYLQKHFSLFLQVTSALQQKFNLLPVQSSNKIPPRKSQRKHTMISGGTVYLRGCFISAAGRTPPIRAS